MKTILMVTGLLLSYFHAHAAIISGVVKNEKSGEPIPSVYLNLKNTNKNTFSDMNGIFKFSDIQPGTYTLLISIIGDKKEAYQFPIATEYDSIFIKINLAVPNGIKLDCTTEIEAYQQKLNDDFPDIGDALDIQLSRVLKLNDVDDDEGLFVQLNMTNNALVPLYLFKDYFCLPRITPIVITAEGDTIVYHYTIIDCDEQPVLNHPSDLIELKAGSTLEIKEQRLGFYYRNQFPPGDYRIKITYEYQFPNYIDIPDSESQSPAAITNGYCKVIRGRFESNWLKWSKK